jgi:hypothetical protein
MSSQQERTKALNKLSAQLEALSSIDILYARLETLSLISSSNILLPAGAQEHYPQIIEEAYAAYNRVETILAELHQELEYYHQRLQESREQQSKEQYT